MRAHVHAELRHHAPEGMGLRDRAVVQIQHPRDALQHQAWLVLGRHRVEQEAQRGGDVLAIDAAVFLVGNSATIVDRAEQHQRRRPSAGFDPERSRNLLEVGWRQIELPAFIGVRGLEPRCGRGPAHPLVVQAPSAQVAVDRGAGEQVRRCAHQPVGRLDPVLDQQLEGAIGREVTVLLVRGSQLHRGDQLAEALHLALRAGGADQPCSERGRNCSRSAR